MRRVATVLGIGQRLVGARCAVVHHDKGGRCPGRPVKPNGPTGLDLHVELRGQVNWDLLRIGRGSRCVTSLVTEYIAPQKITPIIKITSGLSFGVAVVAVTCSAGAWRALCPWVHSRADQSVLARPSLSHTDASLGPSQLAFRLSLARRRNQSMMRLRYERLRRGIRRRGHAARQCQLGQSDPARDMRSWRRRFPHRHKRVHRRRRVPCRLARRPTVSRCLRARQRPYGGRA